MLPVIERRRAVHGRKGAVGPDEEGVCVIVPGMRVLRRPLALRVLMMALPPAGAGTVVADEQRHAAERLREPAAHLGRLPSTRGRQRTILVDEPPLLPLGLLAGLDYSSLHHANRFKSTAI